MKKIIVFGSTGTIGQHLVSQALTAGHQVTAFLRNRHKMSLQHERLSLVVGDVLDQASVQEAIAGHDAVMCALGAGRKGTIRSQGTLNIIQAMQVQGIDRLICETTLGAGDSVGNLNFFWKHVMFGWFIKEAYEDHQLQEQYIKKSQLDWTIVRPGAFTNGVLTKRYRHGFSSTDRTIKLKVSRADVAHFMLQQIGSSQYLRQTPGLSY